jgi:hypothetical protein
MQNEDPNGLVTVHGPKTPDLLPQELMQHVSHFSQTLIGPISDIGNLQLWMATLRCYLPPIDEAQRLFSIYYEYAVYRY